MEDYPFFAGYVACALWSSTDDDGNPLDREFDEDDIEPETLAQMKTDCARFERENEATLRAARDLGEYAPLSFERAQARAGHDFWLTRNGHGAGFWDRGLHHVGERLTVAARAFGDFELMPTDDGALCGFPLSLSTKEV